MSIILDNDKIFAINYKYENFKENTSIILPIYDGISEDSSIVFKIFTNYISAKKNIINVIMHIFIH